VLFVCLRGGSGSWTRPEPPIRFLPIVHRPTMIAEDYDLPIGSPGRYSSIRGIKGSEPCLISYHWKFDKADNYGLRQVYYGHIISHKNGQVSIVRPSPKWSKLLSKDVMHGWEDATTRYTMSSNYILRSYDYNMPKSKLRDLRKAVNPSVQHHLPVPQSQEPITWMTTASCLNIRDTVRTHTSYSRIYGAVLFFIVGMYTAGCNVSAMPVFLLPCVLVIAMLLRVQRQCVYICNDDGKFVPWFEKKQSNIPKAGSGLFAATDFKLDQVISKYLGERTTNVEKKNRWLEHPTRKQYIYQIGNIWVAPRIVCEPNQLEDLLFAHYMNHSDSPNCQVDGNTGCVHTMYSIETGEELTINYNNSSSKEY